MPFTYSALSQFLNPSNSQNAPISFLLLPLFLLLLPPPPPLYLLSIQYVSFFISFSPSRSEYAELNSFSVFFLFLQILLSSLTVEVPKVQQTYSTVHGFLINFTPAEAPPLSPSLFDSILSPRKPSDTSLFLSARRIATSFLSLLVDIISELSPLTITTTVNLIRRRLMSPSKARLFSLGDLLGRRITFVMALILISLRLSVMVSSICAFIASLLILPLLVR